MSRNVSISLSRGYKYVRVCESYRNAQGQPRSRTVESHGRLDLLEQKDPGYVDRLRERVARENEAERQARQKMIENTAQDRIRKLETAAKAGSDYGCAPVVNLGSALLRQIWKEDLLMPQLFRYLQGKTGIEYSYDQAAFLLSSQRILHPCSKKKTFERRHTDIVPCNIEDQNIVYRVLDRLSQDKKAIVRHLNRQLNKKLNRTITAAFYDVTTYAFESRNADDLKDFGLSKDHKVNEVQVVLGLVMDEHGIPIDYELFSGSTSEFGTMLPIIKRIKKDYQLKTLVVVADRGLNSNENLHDLLELGCDFVIAQKVRNCAAEQQEGILDSNGWTSTIDDSGEILCRYKTMDLTKTLYETKISPKTGKKIQTHKKIGSIDVRWVVSYSQARANKDISDLNRAIEKAEKALQTKSGLSSRGYKSLIVTPKGPGTPRLNTDKIQTARQWAGYYAICTNLKNLTPQSVVGIYRNLWKIEDCFRVSKTTLETRPCFVWTADHIRGHFMSCFISLVIEKYMRHVLKQQLGDITNEQINAALRSATVAFDSGNPQYPVYLRLYGSEIRFDEMLRVFNLTPPCRYESATEMRRKMRLREVSQGDAASQTADALPEMKK